MLERISAGSRTPLLADIDSMKALQRVGGGEKVCHFGGQKGASGMVTPWPPAGAATVAQTGLSSEGLGCCAR